MHGGDIFFAGIARTMVAKPVVPQSFQFQLGLKQDTSPVDLQKTDQKLIKAQMQALKKMTTVKKSTGGGSGLAQNPPSPSKFYKAATQINPAVNLFAQGSQASLVSINEDINVGNETKVVENKQSFQNSK